MRDCLERVQQSEGGQVRELQRLTGLSERVCNVTEGVGSFIGDSVGAEAIGIRSAPDAERIHDQKNDALHDGVMRS